MVEVKVNPGVCGFTSVLKIESEDMQMATVSVETECSHIKELVASLGELDSFVECLGKFGKGELSEKATLLCKHAACPIPTAILKAIEVECGLALPRNVEIEILKK